MRKISFLLFIFLISFCSYSQEELSIKGKILNFNTQSPLDGASVYLLLAKDSTQVHYTVSDKNGQFKIATTSNNSNFILKISYVGYQSYYEDLKGVNENKNFPNLFLIPNENKLKEVIVKSETPEVKIKNDTVEFNAASFKVRPDSNVETLLKEIPGFEVNADGKMLVNGKEISQFLVNGKPFFDRDGAILLKNLPAEIINKIQVSDFKTKKEEYAKQESSSDYSSVNLTIDEKKNKGFFGKFLGGYGTDDRYETSFVMNYFKGDRKISALGASNNINSSGLSNDEVFDNMGGGRNTSNNRSGSSNSGRGITTTNLIGINYTDKLTEKLDGTGNYNFNNTVTENDNKTKQENLLPDGNFITESSSTSRNESTNNKANLELEYEASPKIRVFAAPKFNNTRSNSNSTSSSISRDENNDLLNEANSNSFNDTETTNFSNSINFNKTFEKPSRNLSLVLNNSNSSTNGDVFNKSETIFYQSDEPDDIRNQQLKNNNSSDSYSAEIEYTEPITDKIRFRLGTEYEWKSNVDDVKTFDFDNQSGSYTNLNAQQSNYTSSTQNTFRPKAGITYNTEELRINLNSETSITQYNNHSDYLNILTDLNKKYLLPNVMAQVRYRFERSKFMTARYRYSNTLPTADQLLPVIDLSNPLNTVVGNPNLNPTQSQTVNLDYRNFDFKTRSGYSFYLKGEFIDNDVISASIYDENRKRTTTYRNVSGTYSTSAGGNWSKQIKKENQSFRYGLGLNASLSKSKGFTNSILYDAKSIGLTPRVYANYELTDFITISPSYGLTYNITHYNNYTINETSNFVHRANIQTTTYWPKHWIFGNDFGYTYNSNLSSDFKKDFYLWNTSLSYSFFKDQLMAKVKVYDVLNQNQSVSRTISATAIRDEENTILRRYAMFSLTYKIKNFAGSKNNDPERPQGPRMRLGNDRNDF